MSKMIKSGITGKIYNNASIMLSRLLSEGWCLKVVLARTKQGSSKVEFRIHQTADQYSAFHTVTKYQAIKYLTKSQSDNLKLYEKVKKAYNYSGLSFGRRLDVMRVNSQLRLDDIKFDTMVLAYESRRYTEL